MLKINSIKAIGILGTFTIGTGMLSYCSNRKILNNQRVQYTQPYYNQSLDQNKFEHLPVNLYHKKDGTLVIPYNNIKHPNIILLKNNTKSCTSDN